MASYTPNLDLLKKDPVADAGDTFNIKTMMNDNWDKIDAGFGELQTEVTENMAGDIYGVATGTNTLVMTNEKVSTYKIGMLVAFKNTTANTGAVTLNINNLGAKSIKKSNGNDLNSGKLKPGGIYQVRYDGINFFLLGEGGEYGTAGALQVLEGFTVGTDNGLIDGTMPNRGSLGTITPGTANKNYSEGYYPTAFIVAGDADLKPINIADGINIFDVQGIAPIKRVTAGDTYVLYNKNGDGISADGVGTYPKNPNTTMARVSPNFTIKANGSVRISFNPNSAYLQTLEYQVYKNGSPVGIKRIVSEGFPTFTEDFICSPNDVFAIYGRRTTPIGSLNPDTYSAFVTMLSISSIEKPYFINVT